MLRLGGSVITTESASEFSSAAKGETLEDTIRVVNSFADIIVLRHFDEGASEIAANYSKVPIINAGDGKGEHPSQALLDLYTIFSKFKIIEKKSKDIDLDITISMVGDLKNGRTIHSLTILLSLFPKVKFIFVSPKALAIPIYIKKILKENDISFQETANLDQVLGSSDVIYQTRVQKERFKSLKEYNKFKNLLILDKNSLTLMKKDAIIMHPLPRINEITKDVDNDPRALYFKQVQNGLFVRMALLIYLFDKAN
jgi:aspartate carbamoyltransferase catalytic subunit